MLRGGRSPVVYSYIGTGIGIGRFSHVAPTSHFILTWNTQEKLAVSKVSTWRTRFLAQSFTT
jgi:hypothetical protein